MSYMEYLIEMGIDKDKPIQIQWNEKARGFYCPICSTGVAVDAKRCGYCGQLLIRYFDR